MFQTLVNAFKDKEIRRKMFYTFALLLVYRIGCFVPIPGLDARAMGFESIATTDFLQMLSAVTGSSFSNGTIFALGIIPFINSFIIMQLLTLIIPKLERLTKEGEDGRQKITQYTRYLAILLALIQAIGIIFAWRQYVIPIYGNNPTKTNEVFTMISIVIILVGGSSMVMWIAERITEFGIGNGTSLIIFIGIISSLGAALLGAFRIIPEQVKSGNTTGIWYLLGFLALVFVLFVLIVFVDSAERRVGVTYAGGRVFGNRQTQSQTTYIPIKVNASGVMPIIFASSLIMFPQMIIQFAQAGGSKFGLWWAKWLGTNGHLYGPIVFILIIFFAYFYAQIQFNPDDVAKMLKERGGMLVGGITPGKPTSDYLRKINNRLTLFGAIYLGFLALIPALILQQVPGFKTLGFGNAFSATGLLIVVSVALEFQKQLESQLLVRHNRGFLK
ncbi:MAG TPA: preprotein translocase subunit SecY [Clostridiales bacterium]|nr:preprotein translocase subunit SecY [Clostridiales bacterium]